MKRKSKGFTLIEVLGTIVIITIVFGIAGTVVFNIINNSKSKSKEVAISNIERIGKVYVNEYPEEIGWVEDDNDSNKYTCVSVKSLISKGYLKEEQAIGNYIKIVKDNIGNVISNEMVDGPGTCGFTVVDVPTSKELCNNLTYNGLPQDLVKIQGNNLYNISNNKLINGIFVTSTSDTTGTTAGDYKIKLKLDKGYVWNDDSSDDKSVTCTINKGNPALSVNPREIENPSVGKKSFELTSWNVKGKIFVKSSDLKYVTIGNISKDIEHGNTENIELNILATRDTITYITITVVPIGDYAKNYYSSSTMIRIGSIDKAKVNVTYKETDGTVISSCGNNGNITVDYKGEYGDLCEPTKAGYKFEGWYFNKNLTGTKVTSSTIVNNYEDHDIYAKWIPNIITVQYNANGGSMASAHGTGYAVDNAGNITFNGKIYKQTFEYDQKTIDLSNWNYASKINIIKTGHKAVSGEEWKNNTGVTFNQNKGTVNVNNLCDATNGDCSVTLYVNWTPQVYTITYKGNGGSSTKYGSEWSEKVAYGSEYKTWANFYNKSGYTFIDWNENSNGSGVSWKDWINKNLTWTYTKDVVLYAQWEKPVTLKLKYYSGTTKKQETVSGVLRNDDTSVNLNIPSISGNSYNDGCGAWEFKGWTTSESATASKEYANGNTVSVSDNIILYARYDKKVSFILDYNGANNPISSIHKTMHRSASGKSNNIGPFTETLNPGNLLVTRSEYKLKRWCKDNDGIKNSSGSLSCDITYFTYFSGQNKLCGSGSYCRNANCTDVYCDQNSITVDYTCNGGYIFADWTKN